MLHGFVAPAACDSTVRVDYAQRALPETQIDKDWWSWRWCNDEGIFKRCPRLGENAAVQHMCAAGLLVVHSYINDRLTLKLSFDVPAHTMQALRNAMHSSRYSEACLAAGQIAWVKCTSREQYQAIMNLYLQGCAQLKMR